MDESWDAALRGVAWQHGRPKRVYSLEALTQLAMARLGLTYDAAHDHVTEFLDDDAVFVDFGSPAEVRTVLAASSTTG